MIGGHAQGELLAQLRPGGTSPVTLFQNGLLRMEITLLKVVIVPGTGGSITIQVYHDDDGTTYNSDTLIDSFQQADNGASLLFQAQHPGSGIHVKPGGSIGVAVSTADVVNFSLYGVPETLAERVRSQQR